MSVQPMPLVRHVLMVWLTLTFVFSWLPLVRALMDGAPYQWGKRYFDAQFSGAGLAGRGRSSDLGASQPVPTSSG